MFKLFTFLVVVGLAAANPLIDQETACAAETGGSLQALENYRENHVFDPEDHVLKCMVKCTLFKESFVQADGVLDVEAVADVGMKKPGMPLTREQLIQELRQCENSNVEGDACDKGFFFAECMINLKNRKH